MTEAHSNGPSDVTGQERVAPPAAPLPIKAVAGILGDPVEPAAYPEHMLRHRDGPASRELGLEGLSDEAWVRHFARFEPLPRNLERPLALRYHGHQFGTYNPQLGDGRGFLFAQLQDAGGCWRDLGTKGSGQTPYSRQGDGRLTLKGGVREILASGWLRALGVPASRCLSLVETGESLWRGDEPSPTRSAVLVRSQRTHVRFGSFQRLAYLGLEADLATVTDWARQTYHPDAEDVPGFLRAVTEATAAMTGAWMAAGFVHGVMNTDNFVITGETFDFGPWRFLEVSDPNFTAAYFDERGLYRFGRQPLQALWALQQLGGALTPLAAEADLKDALSVFDRAYQDGFSERTHALLGVAPSGDRAEDLRFLQSYYGALTDTKAGWARVFHDLFGGGVPERLAASPQKGAYGSDPFREPLAMLRSRAATRPERLSLPYFEGPPADLSIGNVEAVWAPVHERDDWSAVTALIEHIEDARRAYGFGA